MKSELADWKTRNCISREPTNELLQILIAAGHTDLPKDARTLVYTPKKTRISECPPGEYFHHGLEEALKEMITNNPGIPTNIEIDVNIDGLPITKTTKRTLWPILVKKSGKSGETPYMEYSRGIHGRLLSWKRQA